MQLRSDRLLRFEAGPEEVWAAMADVGSYPDWWPWLRDFTADGLWAGGDWRCRVKPPLPYSLRIRVALIRVDTPHLVEATVGGDLTGLASVAVDGTPSGGTTVRLRSELGPTGRLARALSTIARPVARYGHDWVLDTGAEQFRERALGLDPAR